jgi:putative methanogen marker protein 4
MIDVEGLLSAGRAAKATVGIGLTGSALRATVDGASPKGALQVWGFDDPGAMVRALEKGEIDAAVRGTMSSSEVLRALKSSFKLMAVQRVAVMTSSERKPFLLAPVGIDEGVHADARMKLAIAISTYFLPLGWKLKVGVLSKGRLEDRDRGSDIRRSIDEGEALTGQLKDAGLQARHHTILIEDAVRESDLVLAPDGVSGNLIFRTLHFVGGHEAYGAPVVNIPRVFVDTSRAKADFSSAVLLAAGLVQKGVRPRART